MEQISTRLLARLEEAMIDFVNKNCETDEWPDIYVGYNLAPLMAKGAATVLEAQMDRDSWQVNNG